MLNLVQLIGNLGADPDVRYTQAGKAVGELRVATSFGSGEKQQTEWHRVVLWEKLAENAATYLHKGSKVYISGRLQTRSFDNKEGNKQYVTEIVAQELKFLDAKSDKPEAEPEPKKTRAKRAAPVAGDNDLPF